MKLISMIDFVSIFYNDLKSEHKVNWSFDQICNKIFNYANFLKQPLNLGMFVPCDEDGDVLEKPEDYENRLPNMMTEYNDEVYRYKQAKEKVLFKGFKINGNYIYYGHFMVCLISEIELYTVESLLNHFIPETEEVQLTESVLKQIGL